MGATVFQCPECSQLNTTRRLTCKNCGIDLKLALAGIEPMKKSTRGSAFARIFDIFLAIVILVILSAIAVPKFVNLGNSPKLGIARGVGSAVNSTIRSKHSDFLTNAVPYTMDDVLSGTSFTGSLTHDAGGGVPDLGEVTAIDATHVGVNVNGDVFRWVWTAQTGDTPALIEEQAANFPTP